MLEKINVSRIVKDHIITLRSDATGRVGWNDFVIFLLIPVLLSVVSFYYSLELKENIVTLLIAAFSIFAGLLINVLVLIYTVAIRLADSRADAQNEYNTLEREFLRQIFSNVSFSILLSVFVVFMLFICVISTKFVNIISSSICAFLIAEFILTLLMSLKRLHALLISRIELD